MFLLEKSQVLFTLPRTRAAGAASHTSPILCFGAPFATEASPLPESSTAHADPPFPSRPQPTHSPHLVTLSKFWNPLSLSFLIYTSTVGFVRKRWENLHWVPSTVPAYSKCSTNASSPCGLLAILYIISRKYLTSRVGIINLGCWGA